MMSRTSERRTSVERLEVRARGELVGKLHLGKDLLLPLALIEPANHLAVEVPERPGRRAQHLLAVFPEDAPVAGDDGHGSRAAISSRASAHSST